MEGTVITLTISLADRDLPETYRHRKWTLCHHYVIGLWTCHVEIRAHLFCPCTAFDTSLLLQTICSPRLQSGKSNTSITEYLTIWSKVWTRLQTTINRLAVEATSVHISASVFTLMGKFGSDPSTYKMETTHFSETPLPASKTVSKPRPQPEPPFQHLWIPVNLHEC